VTADQITLAGFVIGALSLPALAFGLHGLALVLIGLNRIMDGLDGAVARPSIGTPGAGTSGPTPSSPG